MKKQIYESKAALAGLALVALAVIEFVNGSATLTEALLRFFEGIGIVGIRQAIA